MQLGFEVHLEIAADWAAIVPAIALAWRIAIPQQDGVGEDGAGEWCSPRCSRIVRRLTATQTKRKIGA